jgi:hypothetical protein
MAVAAIRLCRDRGLAPPRWVRAVPVTTLCTLAVEGYRASHRVREQIVLFRATSGVGDNEPVAQVYADPLLGWEARTAKGVRCIDVPGGHLSMLQEPDVAILADRLRTVLPASPPRHGDCSPASRRGTSRAQRRGVRRNRRNSP